jgi:dihydropteroate synthase-like protein
MTMTRPHYLFVTGKLAEPALRRTLNELAPSLSADFSIAVLPISVVALATTPWIAAHLAVPGKVNRIVLPGLCNGNLDVVADATGTTTERGPEDLRDLPDYFGQQAGTRVAYGQHDISILAEINHAGRLGLDTILSQARHYRDSGADIIDLGCDPGPAWEGVDSAVRALRAEGFRVSIDTFNPSEAESAIKAGAELVLSVNSSNVSAARDWGSEVVTIPDDAQSLDGLDRTVERLTAWGVRFRIDPILEPIGFGFAPSLGRYLEVRRRYPQAEMMMGIGNLTELTDADSAGINVLLLGFCQELGIRSVLTTEVINWCQSAVRELALARKLVHFACMEKVLPKRVESALLLLRDPKVNRHGEEALRELARQVKDPNFRLFAEDGQIHVINDKMHLKGRHPFELFEQMSEREQIDLSHAFYLGYELAKAMTALTLGKNYTQDRALRWGFLTVPEQSGHDKIRSGE